MSDVTLELESGKTATFKTAGKVCKDNIVVTATGGSGGNADNADYIALVDGTMTEFVAPKGAANIKNYLFYEHSTLQTADLRNVEGVIGKAAFGNCEMLSSVQMPKALTHYSPMASSAFAKTALIEFEYVGAGVLYSGTQSLFSNCKSLKKINIPNISISGTGRLVENCSVLEEIYVGRITNNFQVGSGTTYGHLIKVECLVGLIQNLVVTTKNVTLTIGTANMEKIAGLYCRITDDTTDTLTMELCESTDEGAMPIADYWALKGWNVV